MHKLIQTRTHTPCAVSFSPSAGHKGAAAGGTASVSVRQQEQALRHRASRQVQPVVARLTTRTLRHMHRHIQTHTHTACAMSFRHRASRQMQRAQCTRTMETGRARPRLVSTHDRTRMCNAVDEATTTCQQPHQRRDALLLPFARRTRQKERNLLRVCTPRNNHSERDALSIKSIRDDTQRVASRDPLQKTITRQPIHT